MTRDNDLDIVGDLNYDNVLDLDLEAGGRAGSLSRNSVIQSTRAIPSMAIYKPHNHKSTDKIGSVDSSERSGVVFAVVYDSPVHQTTQNTVQLRN